MDKIHWYLGMIFSVKYRKWYYKTHNKRWLWGIYSLMNNGFYRLDNIIRVKKFKVLKEL